MLTIEQVRQHSEVFLCGTSGLLWSKPCEQFQMRLLYLKNDKICRLGFIDDFAPGIQVDIHIPEDRFKFLIPHKDWERFVAFVNKADVLTEEMLITNEQNAAHSKNHYESGKEGNPLGTYYMFDHGIAQELDVQGNFRAFMQCIYEAAQKLP